MDRNETKNPSFPPEPRIFLAKVSVGTTKSLVFEIRSILSGESGFCNGDLSGDYET